MKSSRNGVLFTIIINFLNLTGDEGADAVVEPERVGVNPDAVAPAARPALGPTAEPKNKGNPQVYLDIKIGKQLAGRIVVVLRADICPKTAEVRHR